MVALLAAGLIAGCSAEPPPAPTNLLMVCIDTLRADHVGAYGYRRDTTPHLDALAAGGVLFEDVWAHAPWTVPATASLLTGLYPSQHGAGVPGPVKHLGQMSPSQIAEPVDSLAERLASAGLRTGLFSANPYLYGSFQRGFDAVEVEWVGGGELTDRAMTFIRSQPEAPFFAYLQYMDLHQPIRPPQPFFDYFPVHPGGGHAERHVGWRYSRLDVEDDPRFRLYRDHKIALYDGALRYVDHEIGRLLTLLDELGLADRTLVVVTSDHGEEFWDHWRTERGWGDDPRNLWGVGHGHSMFQELLRVPLVIAGPRVPAGGRSDCPVRHVDVLPTVTELLGLPAPGGLPGDSLVPAFAGDGDEPRCTSRARIAEAPAYGPDSRAIVWRGRKLVVRSPGGPATASLLFDLRQDPGERRDLADQRPEATVALAKLLDAELGRRPEVAGEPMQLDDESVRELRALGYL